MRGILTKVTEGEADAGVVYVSDVFAAGDDAEGVDIPADINVVAEYPIAGVTEAANPDGAAAFIDYVLSDEGQGFSPTTRSVRPTLRRQQRRRPKHRR